MILKQSLEQVPQPMRSQADWPNTFRFGDFVRLVRSPQHWGRIVAPSELIGRWVFEYADGARVTNSAEAFELFEPTEAQRRQTEQRFAMLGASMPRPEWPGNYSA